MSPPGKREFHETSTPRKGAYHPYRSDRSLLLRWSQKAVQALQLLGISADEAIEACRGRGKRDNPPVKDEFIEHEDPKTGMPDVVGDYQLTPLRPPRPRRHVRGKRG